MVEFKHITCKLFNFSRSIARHLISPSRSLNLKYSPPLPYRVNFHVGSAAPSRQLLGTSENPAPSALREFCSVRTSTASDISGISSPARRCRHYNGDGRRRRAAQGRTVPRRGALAVSGRRRRVNNPSITHHRVMTMVICVKFSRFSTATTAPAVCAKRRFPRFERDDDTGDCRCRVYTSVGMISPGIEGEIGGTEDAGTVKGTDTQLLKLPRSSSLQLVQSPFHCSVVELSNQYFDVYPELVNVEAAGPRLV
ncbi:hypothetical protein FB451DRAFT_1378051 [Mycena latifolia]|nr:hypothetical protein FB451DRAFT_1378051 [Mycena latifolia]